MVAVYIVVVVLV